MSSSIWHKPDEKPIYHKWACVKYPKAPVKPVCKFIEEDTYISYACEYAYIDDLIAQANKVERLQKALDLAVDALDDIRMTHDVQYDNGAIRFRDAKDIAVRTKKEIKQLIKGE